MATETEHQVDQVPSSDNEANASLKRLTVNIPDELHHRVKVRCAHERLQISELSVLSSPRNSRPLEPEPRPPRLSDVRDADLVARVEAARGKAGRNRPDQGSLPKTSPRGDRRGLHNQARRSHGSCDSRATDCATLATHNR